MRRTLSNVSIIIAKEIWLCEHPGVFTLTFLMRLQILLAVYFFLAGIAVSHSRLLWVTPFASVAYLVAFMLTTACVASYGGLNEKIRSGSASPIVGAYSIYRSRFLHQL